jgi:hypothetical protein
MSGGITPYVYRSATERKTMVLGINLIEDGCLFRERLRIHFTIYQYAY